MNDWPYPRIVAHRGGDRLAPEDALATIDAGAKYGHKMIEFDAKLSKDGEIFLSHDNNLERTSSGWGAADELSWQDSLHVDAGSWYSKAFKDESLPLLSQVAGRCHEHGMMTDTEVKPIAGTGPLTGKMVTLAARQLWAGVTLPLLSSFEINTLEAAQPTAPELPRGLLLDEWRDDWRELAARLDCVSIHLGHKLLDKVRVMQLKNVGLRVLIYTINKPQCAAKLLRWGVDCICTDAIDVVGPNFAAQQSSTECQATMCWTGSAYRRFSSPAAYAVDSTNYPNCSCCLASCRWC